MLHSAVVSKTQLTMKRRARRWIVAVLLVMRSQDADADDACLRRKTKTTLSCPVAWLCALWDGPSRSK